MSRRLKALSVHLLTATGAIFAMLALLAAVDEDWSVMFFWLVVAFAVDGVDGPLARRFEVKRYAPEIDGVLLDLIIDYLTYVFIPAYALFKHEALLPGWTGWFAILFITYLSAIYFADTRMKTKDNSFWGFPGAWNMLVLVIFALQPGYWITVGVVVVLAIAMFLPIKFVHPMRTERWRNITIPMTALWTACAAGETLYNFEGTTWMTVGLTISTLYLLTAGALQQVIYGDTRE